MVKGSVNTFRERWKRFFSVSFIKTAVFVILFLSLITLVFSGRRPYKLQLNEGDISKMDIYAPHEFTYPGDIDESKMEILKKKALEDFIPIYEMRTGYWDGKRERLKIFFSALGKIADPKGPGAAEKLEGLGAEAELGIEGSKLEPLLDAEVELLEKTAFEVLDAISSKIIVGENTINELTMSHKEDIIVYDKEFDVEAEIPRSDLYTSEQLNSLVAKEFFSRGLEDEGLAEAMVSVFASILTPNLDYNREITETRRKSMLDKIPPVYKQILVKKDELIVGKGQKVVKSHLAKLIQLTKRESGRGKIAYLGGVIILLITFVVMIPVYLNTYRKNISSEPKNIYLIGILILFAVFLAKIVAASPLPSFFIPLAATTMLVCILLEQGVAFMLAIMLSIFAGVITGNRFDTLIVLLVGSTSGIYFIRGARRRSHILKAGLLVGLTKFSVVCGMGLLSAAEPDAFLRDGTWAIVSGIASAGIVMLLLPVFEFIFKIATDITLLELSDLNHPLLKDMILNAPGTYHHSLIVGNLAEAAAESIGANSLLARVGAYYHDIGKTEKAEYFSENNASESSPHDKLAPSMSALIIQSHVKDGVELARKHNMNQAIIDFVAQHHGTSLIYYFYQRALEKVKDDDTLKEEAFRYPGPKPQTKETAIVLLADAVEASSRTLTDPTPSRIKGLVQKIINNKFIDNQLDECDLTLKDLNKIAVAFVRILTGTFHTRVEYPDENKGKNNRKKNRTKGS